MSLKGCFQNGYVTHDLDRAINLIAPIFGLSDFTRFEVELPLSTPHGAQTALVRVGTAWAGKMQLELIEPVSGFVDHYCKVLPEDNSDFTPRFHHLAVRRESVDAMRSDAKRLGLPIVFESEGAGIACMFIDARSHIGHHLEFVCANQEGWAMMGWPEAKEGEMSW